MSYACHKQESFIAPLISLTNSKCASFAKLLDPDKWDYGGKIEKLANLQPNSLAQESSIL